VRTRDDAERLGFGGGARAGGLEFLEQWEFDTKRRVDRGVLAGEDRLTHDSPADAGAGSSWTCPGCHEENAVNFDECRKCQRLRQTNPDCLPDVLCNRSC
jgi:hypothetical protein